MFDIIKRKMPSSVKATLRFAKNNFIDNPLKRIFFKRMRMKHRELIKKLKNKDKIKVVFLVIHKSVWKVDPVFKRMLSDPYFDPIIFICPFLKGGEEVMSEELEKAYDYFSKRGYPTISSFDAENNKWITLDSIEPDIVFFTNPHSITLSEYYKDAFERYLSCYVPYHHEVGSYGNNVGQYNQYFHNAMWKIFSSHAASRELFLKFSSTKAENVVVSGYPAMEGFVFPGVGDKTQKVWKNSDSRLRVIWAPHHTIDMPELPYANFLKYANSFKELAINLSDKVVWAFKPHPLLKAKLYKHHAWGKDKTDDYFRFWAETEYTQYEDGDYSELFCSSDALIHDSGSFLAEYLYLRKPTLYMLTPENSTEYYSNFGKSALNACDLAYSFDDIELFIKDLILGKKSISDRHEKFLNEQVLSYFYPKAPSDSIVEAIRSGLN